jgi:peptidoglycan/xylan/chitin deacetylase (PgdA/CDA1 family)
MKSNIKISNKTILKSIFAVKGNLSKKSVNNEKQNEYIAKYKGDANATVSISADFELAWAFRGRTLEYRESKARNGRANIKWLLNLFDMYNIPITWATVGHLFLENCSNSEGRAHNNMPRPLFNDQWKGDWYKHDPCSNYHDHPHWYAPDLIQLILNSKVNHEIGTHSFSHIDFSSNTSSRELVQSEILKCIKVMKPYGLSPKSLVFPFNHMGHQYNDLLYKLGIIAVRHRDSIYRIVDPLKDVAGLYRIFESMNLRSTSLYDYWLKAKIFLERAIKLKSAYHIWFHPSDAFEVFNYELRNILELIESYVSKNKLWVATMKDLASYCEARRNLIISKNEDVSSCTYIISNEIDYSKFGDPIITFKLPYRKDYKQIEFIDKNGIGYPLIENKYNAKRKYFLIDLPVSTREIKILYQN